MASRVEEEAPALATDEDQISEKSWQKSDREFLMVMVTFIATVSFQAGTNPPGGVWQDDNNPRYTKKEISLKYHLRPYNNLSVTFNFSICILNKS